MSLRTTLSLLMLVGLLAALLIFTKEQADPDTEIQQSVLEGHAIADAKRVTIVRRDAVPIELEAESFGRFRLVEPIVDLASAGALKQLAVAFDSAMMIEAYAEGEVSAERLQQLGLDEPFATLEVEFRSGNAVRIELGGKGPLGKDVFLRRDGKIYRGGLDLLSSLQFNVDNLRDKQVFRNSASTAEEVVVKRLTETGELETTRLVRQGRQGWRMLEPIESRVEIAVLQSFLTQLLSLRVDGFPPGIVRTPDRDPDIVVRCKGSFGDEEVVMWRIEGGHLLGDMRSRKAFFTSLQGRYPQLFANAPGQLRARWLIPINDLPRELMRVELDPGVGHGQRVVLKKEGDREFVMVEPVQIGTRPTPITQMIQALNNCRVVQFVDGEPNDPRFGLLQGFFTVTAHGTYSGAGVSIHLGADDTIGEIEITYARRADEPQQVVAVPRPVADLLRRPWTDFPTDRILELNVPVQTLRLVRMADDEDRSWKSMAGRWQVDRGPDPGAIVTSMGSLRDELKSLRAERALDAQKMDLGKPQWILSLGRDNYDSLADLQFWDRGPDAPLLVQQSRSQRSLVFELDPLLSENIRRLLLW